MAGKPKFCAGKDAFERMNYLYQLSNKCASGQIKNAAAASRFYSHQVVAISRKTVQRLSPSIKRTICKSCHQYLIPGLTCKVRVKKKVVIHKCTLCGCDKRFVATPDYCLWNERPEAVAELLDYRNSDAPKEVASKMSENQNMNNQNNKTKTQTNETATKYEEKEVVVSEVENLKY